MGKGIVVCGLNGCGKSTLGRALAEALGFHYIDIEDLYFTRTSAKEPYTNPRSHAEVEELLMSEVKKHEAFVLAAVKGDYGKETQQFYDYAVLIEVPKEIRMQRVQNRSFQKFGNRMLEGGDLHQAEEQFFEMVGSRTEAYVEMWVQSLQCPVIRVDGTWPIEENVHFIASQIGKDKLCP